MQVTNCSSIVFALDIHFVGVCKIEVELKGLWVYASYRGNVAAERPRFIGGLGFVFFSMVVFHLVVLLRFGNGDFCT